MNTGLRPRRSIFSMTSFIPPVERRCQDSDVWLKPCLVYWQLMKE
jgi:hypothetical protein